LNRTPRTTRRRARLEASLNGLLFLFAVWLGAIRAYSYEINPIFCDGIDDHVGASSLCALPNNGTKDFSKHERTFGPSVAGVIGSRSIERGVLSTV
jgi:hypothetical protein